MAGIIKTEDTASEAGSISEEERIRKLFQACDGDGDGYIDSEDLLSICRKLNLEQCVGELMRELGADEHGRISYQGFLRRRLELAGQVEAATRCLGEEETTATTTTTTTEEEEEGGGGGREWGGPREAKASGNKRQPKYRQPTSSENSLGAGSGGRQERWEFDSGARDLSPEPQASPGTIRGQPQAPGSGLQGPTSVPGPPSSQGPGGVGSPIHQGGTASLLDMANKLHLAALSSLKSEIQDLTGQLKAVTQERDFLERSLSKAQLEKLRLVHDAEERLDSQAQRYEGRLTELHCVIAELSRKIRGQTSRVITEEEEEEEDGSTTTAADDEEEEEGVGGGGGGDIDMEEEDGAGSQSVAADTTQDDLSGVGVEEGVEVQDCCELESGRTELVDGEGTVVPDDATDHTHIQDLVVAQRDEEEGLEQQRRLHRKVKELQGNLQQLQIISPTIVSEASTPPPLPKRMVSGGPQACCTSGCQGRVASPRRRGGCVVRREEGTTGCQSPGQRQGGPLPPPPPPTTDATALRQGNLTVSEMVDLGVCCDSRSAERIIQEESSVQELQLATTFVVGSTEGGLSVGPTCRASAPSQWRRQRRAAGGEAPWCPSSLGTTTQAEDLPAGEQGVVDTSPCGCLPVLRALELELERQAGRAESHRASAELAFLSLDECRSACERQALLLGRRGSDIVGLATAIGYVLPLCRATYILSRLLDSRAPEVAVKPPLKGPEFQAKGWERSRSKKRVSSRGSPCRSSSEAEKSWLCRKREELGKSWRREGGVEDGGGVATPMFVDEGGGYGKINRAVATEDAEACSSSSSGSVEATCTQEVGGEGAGGVQRALELEAAALVESLDRKMRLLSMSECRAEDVAQKQGGGAGGGEKEEDEDWVLSSHNFRWLESLGVEEEDGCPDILRRLGRHISVLLKKLASCGIGLQKAKAMAADASASEGELGLPPHDTQSEVPQTPSCTSSEGRKADLEVAVLMQELMAMREERAALRVRLHALEGEREELGRLCQLATKPGGGGTEGIARRPATSIHASVPSTQDVAVLAGEVEAVVRQPGESSAAQAEGMAATTTTTSREQWLEGRLQELALTLEQVATSADLRLRQSTAVMNDLRRTNGTLAHSLDRCRRRYQQRLKTLEGQMENLVERHASQVRTLRQRISQLEEKGASAVDGGGSSGVRICCSSGPRAPPLEEAGVNAHPL